MLIPWSGGLDSSIILYNELKKYHDPNCNKVCKNNLYKPRAIIFECNQINKKQEEMQEKARNKLKDTFDKKGWKLHIDKYKIDTSGIERGISGTFPQPIMWLTHAALLVQDGEPLIMGWIKGDCAMEHLHDIKKLWKTINKLNGKKSELVVPYAESHKHEMIKLAKERKILTKCWYCEFPTKTGKPCNKCNCCLTMIGARAIHKTVERNDKKKKYTIQM